MPRLPRTGTGRAGLLVATAAAATALVGAGAVLGGVLGGSTEPTPRVDEGTTAYQPHSASVQQFDFRQDVPVLPAGDPRVQPGVAPAPAPGTDTSPTAAVTTYLSGRRDNRPEVSYGVLAQESVGQWPTLAAWRVEQQRRPIPLGFEVLGGTASPDGSVEVRVRTRYSPALTPFLGLVPASAEETFRASLAAGAWRVAADAEASVPGSPDEAAAKGAVQRWLDLRGGCDPGGAEQLQVPGSLAGRDDLADLPCSSRGGWAAGAVERLPAGESVRPFLAAFGPATTGWARAVPASGPGGPPFLVGVAPWGDEWRVFGLVGAIPGEGGSG